MNFLKKLFSKKRSVVFYRHSYYHFFYLAAALRERGWDVLVVNLEPSNGANDKYYHGEDLNLYDPEPIIFNKNIKEFLNHAQTRFKLMHFAGDGYLSFYPQYTTHPAPPDILAWRKRGNKIAYTVSGCNSGRSQSSISAWSTANNGLSVCDTCIWQSRPDICNDEKSLAWGEKLHQYCDLMFTEAGPALDYMKGHRKIIREPVTMCLDKMFWHPQIEIPSEHRIERQDNEILIYHAVGNYQDRSSQTKNIKGTPAILEAIERLQQEGYKVKMIFITDKPNKIVRYYQAQADIIVDQLNYGRYGATAREGMMLGKPVICYLNPFEYPGEDRLQCLAECPLISATEKTVYDELKHLITHPTLRARIGEQSRQYAVEWHASDVCAARYEKAYDQLFSPTCNE